MLSFNRDVGRVYLTFLMCGLWPFFTFHPFSMRDQHWLRRGKQTLKTPCDFQTSLQVTVYDVLCVHHKVHAVVFPPPFFFWHDEPLLLDAVCLVSLGISPCCLCICAVMETAVWQVLGGREGWAVGKWPGFYSNGWVGAGGVGVWSEIEMADGKLRGLWYGRGGAGVFTASLPPGMLLLCCLVDLKSSNPSICAKSRFCLVNSGLASAECFWFNCHSLVQWVIKRLEVSEQYSCCLTILSSVIEFGSLGFQQRSSIDCTVLEILWFNSNSCCTNRLFMFTIQSSQLMRCHYLIIRLRPECSPSVHVCDVRNSPTIVSVCLKLVFHMTCQHLNRNGTKSNFLKLSNTPR